MKKHQFRYVLSLILTLFAFATLVDSQESTEQITEEPNPVEQSATDQLSEEPNPTDQPATDQSAEESNPTESQLNTLEENVEMLRHSFSIFVIIVVVFIILISAFVIFWRRPSVQQQRSMLDENKQSWRDELKGSLQSRDERLTRISRQGDERTQKLEKMESNQSTISNRLEKLHNIIDGIKSRLNDLDLTVANLEPEIETDVTPDDMVIYQVDVESTILETQARSEELVRAYRDGEPIDLGYIETPIPSRNVVLNLNWIARAITEWITELEQSTPVNQALIQTLKYAEQTIKTKLKTIREESMPALKPFNLENLETEAELGDIRDQAITYPAQLEGILIGYEIGRKVDEVGSDQIIPQFIKDQLFNDVARHIRHDQLQEQLDGFLKLVDYEVIPVEVGITEADSRIHEIQDSRQMGVRRGTVAEVISPGLMQKTDRIIVRKPVVIRGE